jgi:NADPH:quinone reductase-like Zn-dependent oxidoreductase
VARDGDVLIKVSAASINPLDKMIRNGGSSGS